jgi:adenylyltransferase and sulfurtransferase
MESKSGQICCSHDARDSRRNASDGPGRQFDSQFRSDEVERYSRQLLLPQLGVRGQSLLASSKALIVGIGGLGCPAALYLAGAGVGTIGLVDRPGDVVERSNLHRQIAHGEDRVGTGKVESAAIAIKALNSNVNLRTHSEFVPGSAAALVADYDVVLDCTDNVASRYLVNDACAASRTPLVSGSAIGLDGQLTVYCLNEGTPCYRCVFPAPPPAACVGSCATAGVLGPVPGTIGTLQALEAMKILAKIDCTTTLASRLLLFDGAEMVFRTVKLRQRDKSCVSCGVGANFALHAFDYEAFASGSGAALSKQVPPLPDEWRIDVHALADLRKAQASKPFVLLDVRPKAQYDMCSLPGSTSIPLSVLRAEPSAVDIVRREVSSSTSLDELPVVVLCRRGNQSQEGVRLLRNAGFENAVDVIGGLQAWHAYIDSSFPLY